MIYSLFIFVWIENTIGSAKSTAGACIDLRPSLVIGNPERSVFVEVHSIENFFSDGRAKHFFWEEVAAVNEHVVLVHDNFLKEKEMIYSLFIFHLFHPSYRDVCTQC